MNCPVVTYMAPPPKRTKREYSTVLVLPLLFFSPSGDSCVGPSVHLRIRPASENQAAVVFRFHSGWAAWATRLGPAVHAARAGAAPDEATTTHQRPPHPSLPVPVVFVLLGISASGADTACRPACRHHAMRARPSSIASLHLDSSESSRPTASFTCLAIRKLSG